MKYHPGFYISRAESIQSEDKKLAGVGKKNRGEKVD